MKKQKTQNEAERKAALAALSGSALNGCDRCDTFGGTKTYENQACLPIEGRIVCVDWCIHHIVAALNAGGVKTVACCCGHGKTPGRIDLADGRTLTISSPNTMMSHGEDGPRQKL